MEKIKFPAYTVRTFLLRPYCQLGMAGSVTEGDWFPTAQIAEKINEYVQHWVTPPSRNIWRAVALQMVKECDAVRSGTPSDTGTATDTDTDTAPWIRAADRVFHGRLTCRLGRLGRQHDDEHGIDEQALRDLVRAHEKVVWVYVVLGPIGAGKTSAAEKMARALGCAHVDGDVLMGVDARRFHLDRCAYTFSEILMSVVKHGCAVTSAGGGALGQGFRSKWRFSLIQKLKVSLPSAQVKLAVCFPGKRWGIQADAIPPERVRRTFVDPKTCACVAETVRGRLQRGAWDAGLNAGEGDAAFVKKIVTKSKENVKFALPILADADERFEFPFADVGTGTQPPMSHEMLECLLSRSDGQGNSFEHFFCNQLRVVYDIGNREMYHETVIFDRTPVRVGLADLGPLPGSVRGVEAHVVTHNGCTLYLLPDRTFNGRELKDQHITVEPGNVGADPTSTSRRKPVFMRKVARALHDGLTSVSLAPNDQLDLRTCQRTARHVVPVSWACDVFVPLLNRV
jgi:hypothetical protein